MSIGAIDSEGKFDSYQGNKEVKKYLIKKDTIKNLVREGIYSTFINDTSGGGPFLGTRADFMGMRAGDNIYFFFNRCIYGIGEIIDIEDTCVFKNEKEHFPFICLFKSSPFFFKEGVDMDDVLTSNPDAFKMLRVFHQRSFIKIDDVENTALKAFIIRKNEDCLETFDEDKHYNSSDQESSRKTINDLFVVDKDKFILNSKSIFDEGYDGTRRCPHRIKSETYIEGMILDYVKRENRLLGYWDFISRQFPASPAKPTEYVDFMDVFGYRYVKGYEKDGIISKYVIMELKSKEVNEDTILQVMKYVDWVCKEFCYGDYSMIEAYIIGYEMSNNTLLDDNKKLYTRNFIKSSKHNANRGIDVETIEWQEVKFVSYKDIYEDIE